MYAVHVYLAEEGGGSLVCQWREEGEGNVGEPPDLPPGILGMLARHSLAGVGCNAPPPALFCTPGGRT